MMLPSVGNILRSIIMISKISSTLIFRKCNFVLNMVWTGVDWNKLLGSAAIVCLLVSLEVVDIFCKQFGPIIGPTMCLN